MAELNPNYPLGKTAGGDYITKAENVSYGEGSVKDALENASGGGGLVSTTWSALKALRDAGTLVAGTWYRITDYACTTATAGTTSAGHAFDVIVRADSTSVLNENAFACLHDGDTYFANCKLSAWELRYCIDNDTTRFDWADSTNGKGVIYWMKDEFNNECFYDFKNIQFYRSYDSDLKISCTINSDASGVACYTFSNSVKSSSTSSSDQSLSSSNKVYCNVVKKRVNSNKLSLNNNCFLGTSCFCNVLKEGCYNNTFGSSFQYNKLEHDCYSNVFKTSCKYNVLGNACYSNIFNSTCESNVLGNSCYSNTFGTECKYNKVGDICYSNTFGNYCEYNTITYDSANITFAISCHSNIVNDYCMNIAFNCQYSMYNEIKSKVQGISLTSSVQTSSASPFRNVVVYASCTEDIELAESELNSATPLIFT